GSACATACGGAICPKSWATAVVSPAGAGCANGKPSASGPWCTRWSSTGWATWTPLTGAAPVSTASVSVRNAAASTLARTRLIEAKPGSKYHFLVDRQGVPLAVQLTAANVHDSKLL